MQCVSDEADDVLDKMCDGCNDGVTNGEGKLHVIREILFEGIMDVDDTLIRQMDGEILDEDG